MQSLSLSLSLSSCDVIFRLLGLAFGRRSDWTGSSTTKWVLDRITVTCASSASQLYSSTTGADLADLADLRRHVCKEALRNLDVAVRRRSCSSCHGVM